MKLYWTDFAHRELRIIYEYYREKAGIQIAKKLVKGIYNTTLKLKKQLKIDQTEDLLRTEKKNSDT